MQVNSVGSGTIYYADDRVRITSRQVVFDGQPYPLGGIRGARVSRWPARAVGNTPIALVFFSCALLTLVVNLLGPEGERTLGSPIAYLAYLLIAFGIGIPLVFIVMTKDVVLLDTPTGLLGGLRSDDESYAENIARTLNLAIEEYGRISAQQPTVYYSDSLVHISSKRFRFGEKHKFGERLFSAADVIAVRLDVMESKRALWLNAGQHLPLIVYFVGYFLVLGDPGRLGTGLLIVWVLNPFYEGSTVRWLWKMIFDRPYLVHIVHLTLSNTKEAVAFCSLGKTYAESVVKAVERAIREHDRVSLYRNPSYAIPRYLLDETDTIPFGLGTVLSVDGDQVKLGTRHHSLGNLQSVDLDEFAAAPGKGVWMSSAGVIAILFVITLLPSVETSVLPILVMGLVTVIAAFLVLRPASKTNRLYEGEVHVVRLNRGSGKRPVFATLNGEAAKGIEEWFKSAMRLYRRPVI